MKTVKYASILILLIAALAVGTLSLSGSARHIAFRMAIEMPQFVTRLRLSSAMESRDFSNAVRVLGYQLAIAEKTSFGQSGMLPGIIDNTRFVVKELSLKGEGAILVPYLTRLVDYRVDLFLPQLWLAQATLQSDPESAITIARKAQKLLPSDDRPYRVIAQAALKLGQDSVLSKTCSDYATAILGGYHPYEYNPLFGGIGIHYFGLEFKGEEYKDNIVRHEGLKIGKETAYSFNLSSPQSFENLRVHLGLPPGIRIELHGVKLFKEGLRVGEVTANAVNLSARHGAFDNQSLITSSRDGDILNIGLKQNFEADQVTLILSISKLPLLIADNC
ncbi:MAG: hypothetical protein HON65_12350 [Rhodospirillales bacterium]|jgi:hypothetical protein|nr:hypothetical protein [Rhodospirillales bacterium]